MVAERIERGQRALAHDRQMVTPTALRRLSSQRALPWRMIVAHATVAWLLSRLLFVALTALIARSFDPHTLLWRWYLWDDHLYLPIIARGYQWGWESAFFPLFPAAARAGVLLLGQNHAWLATLLVANVGTLAGFIAVTALATHEQRDARAGIIALLSLVAAPLAVFLFAGYTEGWFVGLVAWSLLAARRGVWGWAALAALLAGLTRPFGVALVVPLFLEYASQRGWLWRLKRAVSSRAWPHLEPRDSGALLVALSPIAGLGLYAAYCRVRWGDPLMFLHVEAGAWGHSVAGPWTSVPAALQQFVVSSPAYQGRLLIDLLPLAVCAAITVWQARVWPASFTAYMIGIIGVCLVTPMLDPRFPDVFVSSGRYMLPALPVLLSIALWAERRRWARLLVIGGGFLIGCGLTVFWLNGGWLV